MTTYSVSHAAYLKLILHTAKYPHKVVNGVLIGKLQNQKVHITDSIPILHNWTDLSPMLSIAIDLATVYARDRGETVVGFYQSTERLGDGSLSPIGERVVESIREGFGDAVAFVVDSMNLESEEAALIPYVPHPSTKSWKPHPSSFSPYSPFALQNPASPQRTLELIRGPEKLHEKIHDFDEHVEDVSLDWLRNDACGDEGFVGAS